MNAGGNLLKLTDLHDELKAIIADRATTHGDLRNTFSVMAERFRHVTMFDVQPWEASLLMAEAKLARMESGGYHKDHLMDAANYIIIAVYLLEMEKKGEE
jgi:hypothetical protein